MAEDLTSAEGLFEETETIEARPGYSLVVYEVKPYGLKLLAVMSPGEYFRPSVLRPWAKYRAFRVAAHNGLRMARTMTVKSRDQLHDFELGIDFVYAVQDPEALIENRDVDPLRQLRDETERIVRGRVRTLAWEVIKEGGDPLRLALESGGGAANLSALEETRQIANPLGLQVRAVTVERRLPEDELVKELAGRQAEEARDRFVVDLEEQRQRSVLKAHGSLDELTEVLQGMLQRAGEGVDSFPEMQRAVQDLGDIRLQLERLMQPQSWAEEGASTAAGGQLPLPGSSHLLPASSLPYQDGLGCLLAEVCGHLSRVRSDARQRLTATVLRLVAEAVDDAGNETDLEHYRQQLLDALDPDLADLQLDRAQVALLRRLIHTEELRRELRAES